jgi:ketosteroid isomerase-like protein
VNDDAGVDSGRAASGDSKGSANDGIRAMTPRTEHSGAALHDAYQRAFLDRDKPALLSLIAEDAKWHVFGDSAMAGTVQGRDQIWETFFAPQWETPRQAQIHDVLDNGEHVVALGEVSFSGAEGEVRFKTVEVYHHKDGVLTERWFFVDRRQELDRLLDEIVSSGRATT